jgi:hypothetical protein
MDASGDLVPTTYPPHRTSTSVEMIIVAAMVQTDQRYAITIEEAYERSIAEVVVQHIARIVRPQFPMGTQPVEIVRIVKTEHPIVFREIKAAMDCKSGALVTIREP